jgi:hypothetical protein
MTRPSDNGLMTQTAWIPKKFAVKGMFLKLDNEPPDRQDGWLVESVGEGEPVPGFILNDRSQDYKTQRKGSDIERGTREKF